MKKMMPRPNILIITTDQQSHHMMSCAGNSWLSTPNIDRIASWGTRFSRAYCSNPVCTPSRFSWYTGRMPSAIGLRKNGNAVVREAPDELIQGGLGHLMRKVGYEVYFGGKEHLPIGLNSENLGFDYYQSDERDLLATDTASLINSKSDEGSPWLIAANFINPHDICYQAIRTFANSDQDRGLAERATIEMKELDRALEIPEGIGEDEFFSKYCLPLPNNFEVPSDEPKAISHLVKLRGFREKAREEWGEKEWRLHRWAYHRLTERVDGQIGKVLDALEESGQLENTVVIFTSDHGDHSSSHRLEHKTVFYDEAARVPMLVAHGRRGTGGIVNDDQVVNAGLDLMATCLDYAGVEGPDFNKGVSMKAHLEGGSVSSPNGAYAESEIGYMWATKEYKYCHYDACGDEEVLYDLMADPGETKNIALDTSKVNVLKSYKEELSRVRDTHLSLAFT